MNKKEFYNIGRGNLNLNGNFYYGLDYEITDFMRKLEEENTNLKQALYEIREYVKGAYEMATYTKSVSLDKENIEDILQIIDKYMKEDDKN